MTEYRPEIDGLRALSVLAVIFYHADHRLVSGGYAGVDVFFVISGYLITSLILKEHAEGRFSLSGFWERRIRRILPAMLVMMLATAIAGLVILFPSDLRNLGAEIAAQSVLGANFLFASQQGYFDLQSSFKPLLHTWSLAIEEQFYIFLPLVMMWGLKYPRMRLILVLAALFLISYSLCIFVSAYDPIMGFYLFPMRSWEFLIGALIVFLPRINFSRIEQELLSLTALAALLYTFFYLKEYTTNLWAVMILPCLATAVLLWSKPTAKTLAIRFLCLPVVRGIGIISYSLYLWHWPIFVYAMYILARPMTLEETCVLLILIFIISGLSWALVERPIRRKQYLSKPRQVFFAAAAGVLFTALIGSAFYFSKGGEWRFSKEVNIYASASAERFDLLETCIPSREFSLGQDQLCQIGPLDAKPEFIVFGDSFALAQLPALERLAQAHGRAGLVASHNACPPLFGVDRPNQSSLYHCREFNTAMRRVIKDSGVRAVILVARWPAYGTLYMLKDDASGHDWTPENSLGILRRAILSTVEDLQRDNIAVWIVQAPPDYDFDVPRRLAVTAHFGGDPTMVGQSLEEYRMRQSLFHEIMADLPGVRIISSEKALCYDGEICRAELDGRSLYRDSHHISVAGALLMAAQFDEFFRELK